MQKHEQIFVKTLDNECLLVYNKVEKRRKTVRDIIIPYEKPFVNGFLKNKEEKYEQDNSAL